jgi:2-polyprenyl-6-hydroxyphenyl methylase / 3-demethylubiquinone-9 3-methyltransferase
MQTTVDAEEVAKFARHAAEWWQPEGAFHTLHDINPTRLDYIEQTVCLQDQRILDIGCGGGILCEGMAKRGGCVTGLDVEPDAIAAAKVHANGANLKIEYVCQPLETFVAEPFSIITCLEMLEHVADPQMILTEAARLLAPGGYLFLSTINRNTIAYAKVVLAAEYVLGLLPRRTHDYKRFIKPSELAAMVRVAGLEVLDLTGLAYSPFTRTAALVTSLTDNYLLVSRSTT